MQRWDIEKIFDELKSKLKERKSWASSPTAKTAQAQFLCLTHNLMIMLENQLLRQEDLDKDRERERKAKRKEEADGKGANYVASAVQRFTVRSVKFIPWLRNFVYRKVHWDEAVDRLREIHAIF